jgi:hypothetical protein
VLVSSRTDQGEFNEGTRGIFTNLQIPYLCRTLLDRYRTALVGSSGALKCLSSLVSKWVCVRALERVRVCLCTYTYMCVCVCMYCACVCVSVCLCVCAFERMCVHASAYLGLKRLPSSRKPCCPHIRLVAVGALEWHRRTYLDETILHFLPKTTRANSHIHAKLHPLYIVPSPPPKFPLPSPPRSPSSLISYVQLASSTFSHKVIRPMCEPDVRHSRAYAVI